MLGPGIEAARVDFAHFAGGEAAGAFDVFLGHGIGVRIARLADVVEKDFHRYSEGELQSARGLSMPLAGARLEASRGLKPALLLPKECDAVAVFCELHCIANTDAAAEDADGAAFATLQIHNGELIGSVGDKLRGRGMYDCLGINNASMAHDAPKIVTTAVAPEPPRFSAKPTSFRATCKSPASPRICITTSQICPTPVAPTGWPFALSPPLAFSGRSPCRQVRPSKA